MESTDALHDIIPRKAVEFHQEVSWNISAHNLLVLLILSLLFLSFFLIRGQTRESGNYKPIAGGHLIFKTIMG